MSPQTGESTLRESDILDMLAEQGPSIALVIFSGVQYYTGQWFPIRAITNAAKAQVITLLLLLRTLRYIHLPRIYFQSCVHQSSRLGLHCRLGSCSCYRQCSHVPPRLGC